MKRSRLRAGQWLLVSGGIAIVGVMLAALAATLGVARLGDAREALVDRIDPATVTARQFSNAMINEESSVRGYALSGKADFLDPYATSQSVLPGAIASLRVVAKRNEVPGFAATLDKAVKAKAGWENDYAKPAVARIRAAGAGVIDDALEQVGKQRFDTLRVQLRAMNDELAKERKVRRSDLSSASRTLNVALIIALVLVLAGFAVAVYTIRRVVTDPVGELGRQAKRVSEGEFDRHIQPSGPADLIELGEAVEAMRERIVRELDAVQMAETDLRRSNAELEQFAYVASHDLQEPLRKVASFCQMLENRYKGQLDERADQYIYFAVDGARRMQVLINDLLAFSRVGRMGDEHGPVPMRDALDMALANLAGAIDDSGATVTIPDELPVVKGDKGLLALVFQNLIGNALKFHRDDVTPAITVTAERAGDSEWEFAIVDNGIGIEAEYRDRIFLIFQRLHARNTYTGTGIGLAMCRKIVEFHGGRIWLDTDAPEPGATFRLTLPATVAAEQHDTPQLEAKTA